MKVTLPNSSTEVFLKYVAKLNRKATRLGINEIEVSKVGIEYNTTQSFHYEQADGKIETREATVLVQDWEVSVDVFKANGWIFVAAVESLDNEYNIFHKAAYANDIEIPSQYEKSGCHCEHCNVNRIRKSTYIVRNENTDTFKQVGSTCVKDFSGLAVSAAFEFQSNVLYAFQEFGETEMREYVGASSRNQINVKSVIVASAAAIVKFGFVSKAKARESLLELGEFLTPTSEYVSDFLCNRNSEIKFSTEEYENSIKLADTVIEWIDTEIDPETEESEYLRKMWFLVDAHECDKKNIGILVSSVAAYNRVIAQREREALAGLSEYVGEVGKRSDYTLTYVSGYDLPDYGYGTSVILKFRDSDQNVFTWKTGNYVSSDFDKGEEVKLKGTIKEHTEYKGEKQTVLTRCKVL